MFKDFSSPVESRFLCSFGQVSQFSSVAQSCPTLLDPMDCSPSGLPVYHQLPELTQTQVHRVGDAVQPSHPLSSPFPPTFNLSQHQSLFIWSKQARKTSPESMCKEFRSGYGYHDSISRKVHRGAFSSAAKRPQRNMTQFLELDKGYSCKTSRMSYLPIITHFKMVSLILEEFYLNKKKGRDSKMFLQLREHIPYIVYIIRTTVLTINK